MRTKFKILLFTILFCLLSGIAYGADGMTVTVKGKTYEKKTFQNGSQLFTNRTYVVENLTNTEFQGFTFLASTGGRDIVDEGVIIPSSDGKIYILARSAASISGWTKVANATFTYDSGKSVMSVFEKEVTANSEIDIPQTDDFQGVSPLAQNINYTNPDVIFEGTIIVEDMNNAFTPRTFVDGANLFVSVPIYRLDNVPEDFSGFRFMASASNVDDEAVIIPQTYGKVYMIAKKGGLGLNWSVVPNSSFYSDYTCDEMVIYERYAEAGERIEMPKGYDLEGASPLAKNIEHITNGEVPSPMTITVEATGDVFDKRTFENGALLFKNRNYFIDEVPSSFNGFDFLASNGGEADEASSILIPSEDGYIYVAVRNTLSLGELWSVIPNTEFFYNDTGNSKLAIFKREVQAGERVEIPNVSGDFRGVIPLAKKIIYGTTLKVVGDLLDIRTVALGESIFPQNSFTFGSTIPSYLQNKKYAISVMENQGVEKVASDAACEVYAALHYNDLDADDWKFTGDFFQVGTLRRYYIYKYLYNPLQEWVEIPQPKAESLAMASIIFADRIEWTNPKARPESVVIARSYNPQTAFIFNPSITIMPDGDYIASCSGAYRISGTTAVSVFLSKDKGTTWTTQVKNNLMVNYGNLFVHNGDLYIMGTTGVHGDVIVCKSTDKGLTWTTPTDANTGLVLTGEYHTAPVPVVIHNERIWRAMETNPSATDIKDAFVMSAPVGSDLLKASSWTITNKLAYDTNWISGDGRSFKQWLEGNVVVTPEGQIVNMLRIDEQKYDGVAAIATVTSPTQITFDPLTDIIQFPGGGKKFTIRYDQQTGLYWTITNAVFDEDRNLKQSGTYASGIHCGLLRNRLVLMSSDNLRDWSIVDTLISYDNPFFYGFQYIDWQIDGEDIVAVSRTAFEDERGLPVRQHDANYFLFHRFSNFRRFVSGIGQGKVSTSDISIAYHNQSISIDVPASSDFVTNIYDVTGKMVNKTTNQNKISTYGWSKGVYVVQVNQKGKTKTQKIINN